MFIILTGLSIVTLLFIFWRCWFFMRNPKRYPPSGDGLLSPADGYVVYVKRVEAGNVPITIKNRQHIPLHELSAYPPLLQSSGYLTGIFMTAFSVHHNRVPLSGKVVYKHRTTPRSNQSTARLMTNILLNRKPYEKNCEHLIENERVTLGIQTSAGHYSLTQVADKWISHIINYPEVGDILTKGALFGMIRFGSQVDIFIPDQLGYTPVLKPGDYVYAGESILATWTTGKIDQHGIQ